MTPTQNPLIQATEILQETELRKRIKGAVILHANRLFIEAPGNPNKEMLARQLNENHDYAAGRILQHLAFDPEMIGHAEMTDEQIVAKVDSILDLHKESGLWPARR